MTQPGQILLAHNYYLQRGGEDVVFESEKELLRGKGHTVVEFVRHNSSLSGRRRVYSAASAIWSPRSKKELAQVLRSEKYDVAHFHNTFPILSPSIYSACRDAGVPVVQSLHNYRWLCPAATLYRNGKVCEECVSKTVPYPAVVHACYHNSRPQSLVLAGMLSIHHLARTLQERVSMFIAPTEFIRDKFIQNGFPPNKFVVKPHFVSADPGKREVVGHYALFLGRLSEEKGVRTLMKAWTGLDEIPLRIVGDGPMEGEIREYVVSRWLNSVILLGYRNHFEATNLLKDSRFLVVPSGCYEVFPRVIVEAFACGVPVIAPAHGGMKEIVLDGVNGIQFQPGNDTDLAEKVRWAYQHPAEMQQMGSNARKEYEEKYGADRNYEILLEVYRKAMLGARKETS